MHFVVGAFFGAMVLSHRVLGRSNFEEAQKTASGITMGFLAPIFFAAIGVEFQVFGKSLPMVVVVVAAAFLTKVVGGYIGGRVAGLNSADSLVVGFGLNGRGIMELVIANLALANGLIERPLFSTLVLMGMVTTMLTSVLLKWACAHSEPKPDPRTFIPPDRGGRAA